MIASSLKVARNQEYLPWLGLVGVCACFILAVIRIHPTNLFALTQDDSLYFSSAKALAQGKGYVLPSFPGTPAATKYPVFYPWILSWVWRWNPSFPSNLTDAIAVTAAFGVAYIIATFLFLRGLKRIGDPAALGVAAFCALHPQVVFFSGCLLSDIPFIAFALAAIVLAERSAQDESSKGKAAAAGILLGLATLTRVLAVPVAAGITLAFGLRRAWRQLVVFAGCLLPFFALLASRVLFSRPAISAIPETGLSSVGWRETWAYYTSYAADWKQGVPNGAVLAEMLKNNTVSFFRAPAEYFVSRSPGVASLIVASLLIVVTLILLKGIVTLTRDFGMTCFHWILSIYLITSVFWNYPQASRFLLLFLPLFAAAFWVEGKRLVQLVYATLIGTRPVAEKFIAAGLTLLIVLVAGWSVRSLAAMWKAATQRSAERASLLPEKREAYDWLARSTAPNAAVLAYEDASLYLYSGHVAVRPITFPTVVAYDDRALANVLEHATDVARAIRAGYWLVSDDDYVFEWREAYLGYTALVRERVEKALPLVYISRYGHVKVYSLDCVARPGNSCLSGIGYLSGQPPGGR